MVCTPLLCRPSGARVAKRYESFGNRLSSRSFTFRDVTEADHDDQDFVQLGVMEVIRKNSEVNERCCRRLGLYFCGRWYVLL